MPRIILTLFLSLCLFSGLFAADHVLKVCINSICLEAEVADSPQAREIGLMFRQRLAERQGMLFIFGSEDRHIFWMKNMHFPLDMIWINAAKEIVEIKENLPPCEKTCDNIIPIKKSKYVLEVNAGFVKKSGIKLGDKVKF